VSIDYVTTQPNTTKNMKTALEWFRQLPEDIKLMAVENTPTSRLYKPRRNLADAIFLSFGWWNMPQGGTFWFDVHDRATRGEFDPKPDIIYDEAPFPPSILDSFYTPPSVLDSRLQGIQDRLDKIESVQTDICRTLAIMGYCRDQDTVDAAEINQYTDEAEDERIRAHPAYPFLLEAFANPPIGDESGLDWIRHIIDRVPTIS